MDSSTPESALATLYSPLPSATSIRLLEVHSSSDEDYTPLQCMLHLADLENNDLNFRTLSYTWGDPIFRYWYDKRTFTWAQDRPIVCNGVQVRITSNLEAALRTISRRQVTDDGSQMQIPYLWVDSLCVNQSDVAERNVQVGLMAQIYSKASLVISWLGVADRDSGVAIPLLRRLNTMGSLANLKEDHVASDELIFSKEEEGEHLAISDEEYKSLSRFLGRRYFFRCWVLQEIVLANNVRMLCGDTDIAFEELWKTAHFIAYQRNHALRESIARSLILPIKVKRGFSHEYSVMKLYEYHIRLKNFRQGSEKHPFTFHQLLPLTRRSGCMDPRDKVFAMLGMLPPGEFGITSDYNKSIEEVYSEAVRYWINETQNLDILSWVTDNPHRRFPLFASWIGDFSDGINQSEFATADAPYTATGSSTAPPVGLHSVAFDVLSVRGTQIDCIAELAEPWAFHNLAIGFDPLWVSMTLKLPSIYHTGEPRQEAMIRTFLCNQIDNRSIHEVTIDDIENFRTIVKRSTCYGLIRQLHRLCWYSGLADTGAAYEAAAIPILRDGDTLSHNDPSGLIMSWPEAIAQEIATCACGLNLTDIEPGVSTHPLGQLRPAPSASCLYIPEVEVMREYDLNSPLKPPSVSSLMISKGWDTRFGETMDRTMWMRRMARTENGYLGIVPDSTEVGDAVWLLQGGRVPFVMREVADEERVGAIQEQTAKWKFIGDTYVHGVMQGEVWVGINEANLVDIDLV